MTATSSPAKEGVAMSSWTRSPDLLSHPDAFVDRHLGPRPEDAERMLSTLGVSSLGELMDEAVPPSIRTERPLDLGPARSEAELLAELRELSDRNQVFRSYIGLGYSDCVTPPVILRNVLENPGWYTQYTPYQAEIAQGRLEALLNFQTLVMDLTAMDVANSSLLDEGTAAAEAMTLCQRVHRKKANVFFVDAAVHPQTIAVVKTRAEPLGIEVVVGDHSSYAFEEPTFGALLQYPATDGRVLDYGPFCEQAHDAGAKVVVAADLLALTLLRAPGEFGADVVVGNSQRFGVPLGFGGPHAGYMAAKPAFKRQLPGRIVGVSKDARGEPALRLALQTREQHIRRERATSNICTAQVLLAIVASTYAVYHGPDGLRAIARRIATLTRILADGLRGLGCGLPDAAVFDTLRVSLPAGTSQADVVARGLAAGINLRAYENGDVGVALDETAGAEDVNDLVRVFGGADDWSAPADAAASVDYPAPHRRTTPFMTHPVFSRYRSETELLRYLHRLQAKDLSLTTSMIPLGSCTMKLNATAEMIPVTWPGFGALHPFAPSAQSAGYQVLFERLEAWLAEITGFHAVSLQPNAGSQGEYAGLLCVRAYHQSRGDTHRSVCLIPSSAHGTNPASAVLAGMRVVVVACDDQGNIDVDDLRARAKENAADLAALMVTYPSTHGVFEASIKEVCAIVHEHGGQVYLDGANMNALVGLARLGEIGADVCHLNLHKTFCIPHGGGGPGMGPIGVAEHLAPFLPGHPLVKVGGAQAVGAVASAPWGSPSILPISYAYIAMMGADGLLDATRIAILNANYLAKRLEPHYPVLYTGANGRVAHECIIDLRPLKASAGIGVDDVAKRLMDYGYHAPTMSWPVPGTLMIEPTESESLAEIDRFADALIAIREEIRAIENGDADRERNVLKGAPHTAAELLSDGWDRPYTRDQAAYPAPWTREHKYWPPVARIDNAQGDRNLVCACPPLASYAGP
jgi:glycine dehydrogenase